MEEDKAKQKDEKKRQREADKEERKNAAKRKKDENAAAKAKIAKTRAKPKTVQIPQPPAIMEAVAKATQMRQFESEKAFEEFCKKPGKEGLLSLDGQPYVVKDCSRIKAVLRESSSKVAVGIYKIQLPSHGLVQDTGRGQIPWQGERRARLAECMKEIAPQDVTHKCGFSTKLLGQLQVLHITGSTVRMVHRSIERNGIGNIRYNQSGKKQVLSISFVGLKLISEKEKVVIGNDMDVPEWVEKICDAAKPTHLDDEAIKAEIFFHEVGPDELVVIPSGIATIERSVPSAPLDAALDQKAKDQIANDSMSIGFRIHYVEGPESVGGQRLKEMNGLQKSQHKSNDPIVGYWSHLLSGMSKATGSQSL